MVFCQKFIRNFLGEGEEMSNTPAPKTRYMDYVCRAYDMVRDKSRYVVLTVSINNYKNHQYYVWTHCEWFDFTMPSEYLYNWIKDIEPELKDIAFTLFCKLNDKTTSLIKRTGSERTLKDICASHIMEIDCVNSSQ